MRPIPLALCLASAVFLTACSSTPDSRIARSQAAFNQYPSAVQQKIRAGEVDIGFTPEMVLLALGEPARQFTHQTEAGTVELWVYHDTGPRFSFGLGVGSFGRHSATSVGVGGSTGGYDPEEKMRVEFRDGKVTAVEHMKH
jgi:hypothetical protein